jgi:hypothetical protein
MDGAARRTMFYFGAFGGTLPTLANLAPMYIANWDTPLPTIGFLFGLAVWAIVGGGIALTNSSPDVRQAIFAGIAAPAILTNIANGATEGAMRRKTTELIPHFTVALSLLGSGALPTASAQPSPDSAKAEATPPVSSGRPTTYGGSPMTYGSGDWLLFQWSVDHPPDTRSPAVAVVQAHFTGAGAPTSVSIPIDAHVKFGDSGKTVKLGAITSTRGESTFSLPAGTDQIIVDGKPVTVSERVMRIDVNVRTRPSVSGDFLWVLGLPRNYAIDELWLAWGGQKDCPVP